MISNFCKSLKIDEFSTDKNLLYNQNYCLVIFIFNQLRNPSPEFKLYIETIPKSYKEFPTFYKDTDLAIVKNSLLENFINYELGEIKQTMDLIKKTNIADNFKLSEVKHADIAVLSRNFLVKIKKKKNLLNVLAPYTDLFNYNPSPNTSWTDILNSEDDFFTLIADKDIKKGDEIYVDYGNDDDSKLLSYYGFTLKNNKNDLENGNFEYEYNGEKFFGTLKEKDDSIIDIIFHYRRLNNIKISNDQNEKKKLLENDIKLTKSILKSLISYINKERLEKLKSNLKSTENSLNIYRALVAEDKLITKNISYVKQILEILEGGKNMLEQKKDSDIVKSNKNYFNELLL